MNGSDDTTAFLPLDSRIGGRCRDSCPTVGQYLTREQASYIYKKIALGDDKYRHNKTRDRTRETAK